MRPRLAAVLVLALTVGIAGCTSETETSFGLEVGNSLLATPDSSGELQQVTDATFTQGEEVNLVLQNIEGFQAAEDGTYEFNVNMTVTGPDGDTVVERTAVLSGDTDQYVTDGTAGQVAVFFRTGTDDPAGQYTISATVYDEVGGGTASISQSFQLEASGDTGGSDGTSGTQDLAVGNAALARQNATGDVVVADDNVYQVGEPVYIYLLDTGPFQQGDDGLYEFDMTVQLLDQDDAVLESREMVFGEQGHTEIDGGVLSAPYTGISTGNVSAGTYTVEVTVYDQVAGTQTTVSRPVELQ